MTEQRTPPKLPENILWQGKRIQQIDGEERKGLLIVSLDEYSGRKYVSIRFWSRNADGSMWPTKVGVTVRESEIVLVIDALTKAREAMGIR